MIWTLLLGCMLNEPIRILTPEAGVFAGQVRVEIKTSFKTDDVLGLEVFANDRPVAYFEEPPYEADVDFRDLPAGPVILKAVVSLFDGREFETSIKGSNHPNLYEEEVNLVRIPVLVTGEGERGLLGLNDFKVKENGRPQRLERVLSEEQPLELLVLLDVSGSMDKRLITVRRGMQKLLASLKPQDRIQIIGFNHTVFEVFPAGTDKEHALRSLNQLSAMGETNLYGALWSGVRTLSRVHIRRALILFTDGRHELSQKMEKGRELADCLNEAQRFGVPIYTMGCGAGIDPEVLGQIAEQTGGKFFRLRGSKAIQSAFEDVGNQLRHQYLVCYPTQTSRSGWHQIQVALESASETTLRYPSRLYIRRP